MLNQDANLPLESQAPFTVAPAMPLGQDAHDANPIRPPSASGSAERELAILKALKAVQREGVIKRALEDQAKEANDATDVTLQSLPPKRLKITPKSANKGPTEAEKATGSELISHDHGKLARVFLNQEQKKVLGLVENGASTGKSVLLKEVVGSLKRKYHDSPGAVVVTASTGIAACNIAGTTLHTFAGFGLGKDTVPNLVKMIKGNKTSSARWRKTRVLVIDEISMIDGDLFDKISEVACCLRKNTDPFGGIQLVVTGDFFQLPPVQNRDSPPVKFAFESLVWKRALSGCYLLTQVFRQKDQTFVNILNEMRVGQLSDASIKIFKSLSRPLAEDGHISPTELFPLRADVLASNTERLKTLTGDEFSYGAVDGGKMGPKRRHELLSAMMAPERLTLKVDAQVMLIKNIDSTLVNGSLGRVIRFAHPSIYGTDNDDEVCAEEGDPETTTSAIPRGNRARPNIFPVVEFSVPGGLTRCVMVLPETFRIEDADGSEASRQQLPLILAWSMSIHKSQGQTLRRVKVNLSSAFEKGQAYVALSRATSLDGLQVLAFNPLKVKAHPKVVEWYKTLTTLNGAV